MDHLTPNQRRRIESLMKTHSVDAIAREISETPHTVKEYIKHTFAHDRPGQSGKNTKIFTPSHIQHRIDQISWAWFKKHWLIFTILAGICFALYANSLQNVFVSDDLALGYQPIGTFEYIFFQPQLLMRKVVYFITFHLAGREPWAYRFGNILFHIGSVWLTFTFLWVLTKKSIALPASLLLAVHPMMVEAITWISAGVHPQYAFTLLLAFLFYIKSYKNMKYFWISFVLFCLAVLVSEKAIVFPLILLLYERCLETVWANKNKLLIFFGITLVLGLSVGFYALERLAGLASTHYLENGFDNPLITVPVAISSYFFLFLWPQNLTLYQTEIISSMFVFWLKVAGMIVYIAALVMSFRKNKFVFFGLSLLFITLLPMLLPIRIAWVVAERYAYMGAIGVFGVVGYYFSKIYDKPNLRQTAIAIGSIILVLFSIRTVVRNADWKNEDILWVATVKASPNSPNAHNNMGDVYARYNRHDLAAQEFAKAIQLKSNYGDAYHNLGNSLQHLGKPDEAKSWYEKALQINPNIWQTHVQLAAIAAEKKEFDVAIDHMNKALTISPNNADIYMNFAVLYNAKGDKKAAGEMLQKGLILSPNHPKAAELQKVLSQ